MFRSVTCKLGNMRKAVEFTIYPRDAGNPVVQIQSDSRIAQINLETGKGVLSKGRPGGAYNIDLLAIRGATAIEVPQQVIDDIKAQGEYKVGEHLGGGVYVG